jgi:hypothetical protein
MNGDNLNSVRPEAIRHIRNKTDYLKDEVYEECYLLVCYAMWLL